MDFGTNLRNLRIQRKLTQQELALEMGMSQSSITAYEVGVREPTFETVRKFAEFFRVSPSALMPFAEVSDQEYIQRVAELFDKNPKLRKLFDKAKNFGDKDIDVLITVADGISSRG